jgi:hypothetical protein
MVIDLYVLCALELVRDIENNYRAREVYDFHARGENPYIQTDGFLGTRRVSHSQRPTSSRHVTVFEPLHNSIMNINMPGRVEVESKCSIPFMLMSNRINFEVQLARLGK